MFTSREQGKPREISDWMPHFTVLVGNLSPYTLQEQDEPREISDWMPHFTVSVGNLSPYTSLEQDETSLFISQEQDET